jgi:SAM-dependent methyltransferase
MAETVWDRIFLQNGRVFEQPHEDVVRFAGLLKAAGGTTAFDLGCGSGLHVVYLASQGFTVSGMDNSAQGLDMARSWLAAEHLQADLRLGDMHEPLPYPDDAFDGAISIQVIHHGLLAQALGSIAELKRVTAPGGLVLVSVPMERRPRSGDDIIEPSTFLPSEGREAGLPHHIFSREALEQAFQPFEILDVHPDTRGRHRCLLARKPGITAQ